MITGRLQNLFNVFKSGKEEDHQALLEELFITVLGRATSADTNIDPDEIETVRRIYKEAFGKEIEAGTVRTAAKSELFEKTPLESYVKAAGKKLSVADKYLICHSLQQVLETDERVGEWEIDFFNKIINALNMSPAEIAGLVK